MRRQRKVAAPGRGEPVLSPIFGDLGEIVERPQEGRRATWLPGHVSAGPPRAPVFPCRKVPESLAWMSATVWRCETNIELSLSRNAVRRLSRN